MIVRTRLVGDTTVRYDGAVVRRSGSAANGETVRLKPADPFDLIRWLARSQGDPRKAVAELVQNSLDANARKVVVERKRIGSAPAIVVTDDGEGVLPDLSREDALRHLAQHIGHSRKAKLGMRGSFSVDAAVWAR